jgi:hypothetical protein
MQEELCVIQYDLEPAVYSRSGLTFGLIDKDKGSGNWILLRLPECVDDWQDWCVDQILILLHMPFAVTTTQTTYE